MKRMTIMLAALALAVGWSVKVLADDAWSNNRFFGGSFDGYGTASLIQNDTRMYNYLYVRFTGGSKDGWDSGTAALLKLPTTRGTILLLK